MDRALFEHERSAVQEALAEQGQTITIPDPESPEYLGTFLALQRTHPHLARRLQAAEQADPAELLDPYVPRESKVTLRHRVNGAVDRIFNRQGIDGRRVLDRRRAYRTVLYSVGGVVVLSMVYSVVAPKPTPKADRAAQTASAPSEPTAAAFVDGPAGQTVKKAAVTSVPAQAASGKQQKNEDIFPDSRPRPVRVATSASEEQHSAATTPPPPAVFNQVSPDPYSPAPTPSTGKQAPASQTPTADTPPRPIKTQPLPHDDVVASNESPVGTPFGGSDTSSANEAAASPVEPTQPAPEPVPTQVAAPFVPAATTPAPVTSTPVQPDSVPFGGESGSQPQESPSEQSAEPLNRGAALIYQRPAETQATAANTPKSALLYQAPREQAQAASANAVTGARSSALVYQRATAGAGETSGTRSSLIYQNTKQVTPPTALATVASPVTSTPEVPATDPDAPKFAPTSVISGKLFANIRTAAGLTVPAVVVSKDGNWIGTAAYNTALGRVDMHFDSFVQNKNNKTYPVQATAFQTVKGRLAEGVGANIHPIAPTLATDLARAGLNSLNTYAQALQNAATVTSNGSMITTSQSAPGLAQIVRGELGRVFALPEGNQSIRMVADVDSGTDIQVVYGVGNGTGVNGFGVVTANE